MRVYHNTESYIAMAQGIHGDLYDYIEADFQGMKAPITVICKIHGRFFPLAGNHAKAKGATGCPGCFDARRHTLRSMSFEEFVERLGVFNPLLTIPDPSRFKNASTKLLVSCKRHGDFEGVPTRLLAYKHSCKKCETENQSRVNREKSQNKIQTALDRLPKHIRVLTPDPGWSTKSLFTCEEHGEFYSSIALASEQQFVCKDCASNHSRGISRTPYTVYVDFLNKLFPNPPVPFTLDAETYSENVGKKLVYITCGEHGGFYRNRDTVNNGKLGTPCPYCRVNGVSTPENGLVEFVRSLSNCEQGNRTLIAPKELDCWVPAKNLAIEFCGLYWHSEKKLSKTYHIEKLTACNDKGVDLIQVFEDEWLNTPEICKSVISHRLGGPSKVLYARKLQVRALDYGTVRPFLLANHLQGTTPAQHYLGLFDQETLVAVSTFSFNRLKDDQEWELVRYCSLLNTTVVGGLSKLVKHFMRSQQVARIISYCCLRWFNGSGYLAAGFKLIGQTQPTYFYTKSQMRLSRHVTKKHKLRRLLPNFDPNLTETENMVNAGFSKIYDCGNLVFEFTL